MMNTQKKSSNLGDWAFLNVTRLFAILTLLILLGILASLVYGALPSLQKFGLAFLWSSEWNPPMRISRQGAYLRHVRLL